MSDLTGKVALITGGGRGIGRALALRLAREGAHIVLNDLDEEPAQETLSLIHDAGGVARAVIGDITAADFPTRAIRAAVEDFGGLDILVNNAGYIWNSMIQNTSEEQWQAMLDVHAGAPFRLLKEAGDFFKSAAKLEMAEHGVIQPRKVVNVTSVAGTHGSPTMVAYSAGKSALVGLTKSLAQAWGRFNVTVNCVAFGLIETRLTQTLEFGDRSIDVGSRALKVGLLPAEEEAFLARTALNRIGTSEEAAGALYLMCTSDSNYITGQVLECAGGL